MNMKINSERLWAMHRQMASFTEPERPYTRRSFTTLYRRSRQWLKQRFEEAGMAVSTDAAANVVGVYAGKGRTSIAVGSHTDTVVGGGMYDGVSGLLAALECVWSMKEANHRPEKNIICIDFLAEEPSVFGLSCIGSRLATGCFTEKMLQRHHQKNGAVLQNVIDRWGGDSSRLAPGRSQFADHACEAYFELHIEQGRVLQDRGLDVGLVEGICSVTRYDITVIGRADHAGTTPMPERVDALLGAARLVCSIAEIARTIVDGEKAKYLTATVGRMEVFPNGPNIVAEKVVMTLDLRSQEDSQVDCALKSIFGAAQKIADECGAAIDFNEISRSQPTVSDGGLVSLLQHNAEKQGLRSQRMVSGAGHDAAYMGQIMPMAMLFIPCLDGRSHVPSEHILQEQLERGANLLLQTLVDISA